MVRLGVLLVALLTLAAPAQAARRALLVGVNTYPHLDALYQLRGCENDVRLMRDLLLSRYAFAPDQARLLLNGDATRAAILADFHRYLIEPAQPGDLILFYFSGHGSQLPDDNGDETDGLDETLCPADVAPGAVAQQIRDDEIAGWIEALQAKGVRDIVFVLDACHSGTATKSLLVETGLSRPRYLEPARLLGRSLLSRPAPPETAALGAELAEPDDAVLIAGCRSAQQANDARFDGAYHGALSYFLHAELQSAPPALTYGELMRAVRRRVQAAFPTQTPQLEGPEDLAVFGGAAAAAMPPFVVITRADADGVELAAGASAGVTVGSVYAVYPREDQRLVGGGIARIEITAVNEHTARARPLWGGEALRAGCRAVEESHHYPTEWLSVRLDGAPAALRRALQSLDFVRLVDAEENADRVLRVRRANGGLTAQVVTADGLPGRAFAGKNAAALAEALRPELESAYLIKTLARLENPNPSFRVRLSIDREQHPVYYFDRDTIRFQVQAERDCYLTVLDVGTSGQITVLFPNRFHAVNFARAGEIYQIPPADQPGFRIRVQPPAGRELVTVIATEKPLDLTGLRFEERPELFARVPDSLRFAKSLADRVRDFLVMDRPQTTGTPTAGWATDFVTFQICDPRVESAAPTEPPSGGESSSRR